MNRYEIGDIVEYNGSQYKITDRALQTKRNWKLQIVPYYVYAISYISGDRHFITFLTIEWVTDKDLKPHWTKETKLGKLL